MPWERIWAVRSLHEKVGVRSKHAVCESATPSRQTMGTAAHTVLFPVFMMGQKGPVEAKCRPNPTASQFIWKCISDIKIGIKKKTFDELDYIQLYNRKGTHWHWCHVIFQLEEVTKSLRKNCCALSIFIKNEKNNREKSSVIFLYNTSVLYISYR